MRELFDQVENDLAGVFGVVLEDFEDVVGGDGFGVGDDSAVKVGDEADVDDGHAEFVAEIAFGVLGHVDDVPAHFGEPLGFGFGGEAGALDDDDGAAIVDFDPVLFDGLDSQLSEGLVVHIRRGDVAGDGAVVEGVVAAFGSVDELVGDQEAAGFDVALEGSAGAGGNDGFDAEFVHGPDVGSVVDFVGRDGVVASVAGKEGDVSAIDFGEHDAVGRGAVGGIDLYFGDFIEEAVEA